MGHFGVGAPDAEGSWSIVSALHGLGGKGQDLAVTATELASHGNVMFAPDWGSEQTAECSYRYSVSIVEAYRVDPPTSQSQPSATRPEPQPFSNDAAVVPSASDPPVSKPMSAQRSPCSMIR